jgi:hypothetical protein
MIQSVLLLELNPEIGKNPVRPSSQTPLLKRRARTASSFATDAITSSVECSYSFWLKIPVVPSGSFTHFSKKGIFGASTISNHRSGLVLITIAALGSTLGKNEANLSCWWFISTASPVEAINGIAALGKVSALRTTAGDLFAISADSPVGALGLWVLVSAVIESALPLSFFELVAHLP